MLSSADRQAIVERYSARLERYGIDLRTLNVGRYYEAQHNVHASIGDLHSSTILDIGCGLANYYIYLRERAIQPSYIGYDIVAPFVNLNRERFPEATFKLHDVSRDPIEHNADYVVMCQVFNNKYADCDNVDVVQAAIAKAFAAARRGLSIDMQSSYVNFREQHIAYFSPEAMFAFARTLTPFVRLRHDYAPHHFTLLLYRAQTDH